MVKIQPSLTGTIEGDENVERGNWSRQLDFILSCLGYAVGLGNVWRFPYLSYSNGGGAFFIPYFIMLVFVGMPAFFLELSIGQFCSQGPINAFKFSPIFQGVAVGMVMVSATVCAYYGVIISWALFYLIVSFRATLPWSNCDNAWNTNNCSLRLAPISTADCNAKATVETSGFCVNSDGIRAGIWNLTLANKTGFNSQSSASEYYKLRVLKESTGIHELGMLSWELSLCLIGVWVLVYLSLYKGVKSSGKVVYFTALFPYVVLIILFFRGVTLPGAWKGLKYYVTPEWHRLTQAKVWRDAAGQIFFSLGLCWGGLTALASYNRFRNNVIRDTLIVTLSNCGTSIFAGFVIYSYIGNLAHNMNASVKSVSQDGAGLAFVIYPLAVLQFPGSPFWAILFFIMLITLGLDTQFTLLETVSTTILDAFPHLLTRKHLVVLGNCFIFMLPGFIFVTQGGNYILKIVDKYASGWNVLTICILEITAVSFVYKYERFAKDVKVMLGKEPPLFWKICLMGLSQCIIAFVFFFDVATTSRTTYGKYEFPWWAEAIGWTVSICVVLPIPIIAIRTIYRAPGDSLMEKIRAAAKPTYDWGPALPKHRMYVDYVPGWQVHPVADRHSHEELHQEAEPRRKSTAASTLRRTQKVAPKADLVALSIPALLVNRAESVHDTVIELDSSVKRRASRPDVQPRTTLTQGPGNKGVHNPVQASYHVENADFNYRRSQK